MSVRAAAEITSGTSNLTREFRKPIYNSERKTEAPFRISLDEAQSPSVSAVSNLPVQWSDVSQWRNRSWTVYLFVKYDCLAQAESDCVVLRNNCCSADWCLASPPARGDWEQHQVWWHNLRSPTLIWHNPSPSAHHGNIIIHSDTLLYWLTDNVLPGLLHKVKPSNSSWATDGPWNSLLKSNQPAREPITDVWQDRTCYTEY